MGDPVGGGEPVIVTRGLARVYQSYRKAEGLGGSLRGLFRREHIEKVALEPTDLTVEGGRVVGLVGANGAGKTTLLKLLSGLIHPSAGEARVLGFEPHKRDPEYLRRISILLGQKAQLWWDIPPADSFELLGRIYDVAPGERRRRVAELAGLLRCEEMLHVQLRRLSLGERMKMELIGALLHRPRVLFLDEPTIGLDIVAQTTIRAFLAEYVRAERPTIILTSHYMDDIAKLADRLLLISHGRIVYDGTLAGFVARTEARQRLSFAFEAPPAAPIELPGGAAVPAGAATFAADLPASAIAPALQAVLGRASITDLKIEEADFEDVIRDFLESEHRARAAGGPAGA